MRLTMFQVISSATAPPEAEPVRRRATQPDPGAQRAEDQRAVALAHRAVIASLAAHHRAQHARELADGGEEDDRGDAGNPPGHHEGEGQVERGVGHDIAELVEIGTERALLAELARQHAIGGVQRHAQQEPRRHQQEQPRQRPAPHGRHDADGDRAQRRDHGHLVGRHPRPRQRADHRPQQRLEARLQRVE